MDCSTSRTMSPVSPPSPTTLALFIGEIAHNSLCSLAFYSPVNPVGKVDWGTSVMSGSDSVHFSQVTSCLYSLCTTPLLQGRLWYVKDVNFRPINGLWHYSGVVSQTERLTSSIPYIWKCDRRWVAFVTKRASEILSENTIVDVERASEIDTVGT